VKKSKVTKLLILAAILTLPGFFYYLLQLKGKNRYKPLPIYGKHTISSSKQFFEQQLVDVSLVASTEKSFHLFDLKNKIIVVQLFFANCHTVCEKTTQAMSSIAKNFQGNRMIQLLSVSVDPVHDTPLVLRRYAASYSNYNNGWMWVTGQKKDVFNFVKKGLLLDVHENSGTIIHSSLLVLLDSKFRIRSYCDPMLRTAVEKFNDEIKVLIVEELRERTKL